MIKIKSSEITPKQVYLSRRDFLKSVGIVSGTAALLAACKGQDPTATLSPTSTGSSTGDQNQSTEPGMDELGDPSNSFEDITNYNNYYEFTTDKERVAQIAEGYPTSPWEVAVGGLVTNPKTFSIDDLHNFEIEERIYRMRCVEGWSLVIPWNGFPLSKLLKEVEPKVEAKYVRFETIYDPDGSRIIP